MAALAIAQGVLQGASGLAGIYGAYKGAENAERDYELALEEFKALKRRAEQQDEVQAQQLELGNIVGLGQYAQGEQKNVLDQYGSYNRMIGR